MDAFLQELIYKAGQAVIKKFRKIGVKYTKRDGATDVVTEADLLSNRIITEAIRKKYPRHGILSEETGEHQMNAPYMWITDPLDGTFNFSRGIPIFAVMACLVYQKRLLLTCIYDPVHDELFFARKGRGAFLNGRRIRASSHITLKDSYGTFPVKFRSGGTSGKLIQKFLNLPKNTTLFAGGLGSVAHSGIMVASGRKDWYFSAGSSVWDYAPISLLLQESGCKVTDISGKPWNIGSVGIVAANPKMHKVLLTFLQR